MKLVEVRGWNLTPPSTWRESDGLAGVLVATPLLMLVSTVPALGRKLVLYAKYGAMPLSVTYVTPARPVNRLSRCDEPVLPMKSVLSFFAKSCRPPTVKIR